MLTARDLKVQRVLDANFNRAKEGLRVCEDVCRFIYDDRLAARRFKDIRHEMAAVMTRMKWQAAVHARDIRGDVGRLSTLPEMSRKTVEDVLFANMQRVKESVRVLEEFSKLSSVKNAEDLKRMRYRLYHIERLVIKKMGTGRGNF